MKGKGRLIFWMVFLAAAGIAAFLPEWLPPGEKTAEAPPRGASAQLRTVALQTPPGQAEPKGSGMEAAGTINLFAAKTWQAPPPPAPPQLPPPSASALAPQPFQFMGKFDDGTVLKAFLQKEENAYVVAVGDVIEDTYRVAAIAPEEITLIYLPSNTTQILPVGTTP